MWMWKEGRMGCPTSAPAQHRAASARVSVCAGLWIVRWWLLLKVFNVFSLTDVCCDCRQQLAAASGSAVPKPNLRFSTSSNVVGKFGIGKPVVGRSLLIWEWAFGVFSSLGCNYELTAQPKRAVVEVPTYQNPSRLTSSTCLTIHSIFHPIRISWLANIAANLLLILSQNNMEANPVGG